MSAARKFTRVESSAHDQVLAEVLEMVRAQSATISDMRVQQEVMMVKVASVEKSISKLDSTVDSIKQEMPGLREARRWLVAAGGLIVVSVLVAWLGMAGLHT